MRKILLFMTLGIFGIMTFSGCGTASAPVKETSEEVLATEVPEENSSEETASPEAEASEPAQESAVWEEVLRSDITHDSYIEGFLNEDLGITVGYAGAIFYTNTQGTSWEEASNESWCRFSLDIVDENLAWCGGNGNMVCVSKDGGKTWTRVADVDLGGKHSNINFLDDTTGFISSNTRLATTKDGGQTWTELTIPETAESIASIHFIDENTGYLLTHSGLFFKTSDACTTWEPIDIGFDEFGFIDDKGNFGLTMLDTASADINFTDDHNGIIVIAGVCKGEGARVYCLRTSDGCKTFQTESVPLEKGYTANRVFLSKDGSYMTLGGLSKTAILYRHIDN